jgi:hypothetical protein
VRNQSRGVCHCTHSLRGLSPPLTSSQANSLQASRPVTRFCCSVVELSSLQAFCLVRFAVPCRSSHFQLSLWPPLHVFPKYQVVGTQRNPSIPDFHPSFELLLLQENAASMVTAHSRFIRVPSMMMIISRPISENHGSRWFFWQTTLDATERFAS